METAGGSARASLPVNWSQCPPPPPPPPPSETRQLRPCPQVTLGKGRSSCSLGTGTRLLLAGPLAALPSPQGAIGLVLLPWRTGSHRA